MYGDDDDDDSGGGGGDNGIDDTHVSLNRAHSNPESLHVDCAFDDGHSVRNAIIGSNRKIRVVPVENLNVIYNIYTMVRRNFLKCWRPVLTDTGIPQKISTCLSVTLKMSIAEYYNTTYGLNYFDKIELTSCDNRLFTRCREWVMPATDITDTGGRVLYLLIDRAEIDRFVTYYLYVYMKSGARVSVEFDTVCDKVKSVKRKLPVTYLNGSVKTLREKTSTPRNLQPDDGAQSQQYDYYSIAFYFTLLCVDKTISIINSMIMCSGGLPRNVHNAPDKKTIKTSILDTLDAATISTHFAPEQRAPAGAGSNGGVITLMEGGGAGEEEGGVREVSVYKFT